MVFAAIVACNLDGLRQGAFARSCYSRLWAARKCSQGVAIVACSLHGLRRKCLRDAARFADGL
eukprot:11201772-Lingulodinium_polyedra.AAC.1